MEVRLDQASGWAKAREALSAAIDMDKLVQQSILGEAQFLRRKVIAGFTAQGPGGKPWAPLSPVTLAVRKFQGFGGTKILQRTADLKGSISVIPAAGGGAFIGVARAAARRDGKDPVNVAEAMEFGEEFSVTWTAKQRRYIFAAMAAAGLPATPRAGGAAGSGPRTIVIKIPARPFLGPVFDMYGEPKALADRVVTRLCRLLKGAIGDTGSALPEG